MGAAMKRLPAHEGCRLAGNAQRQQHLSFQRALADGVIAIVGQKDRLIGTYSCAVRPLKNTVAPGA